MTYFKISTGKFIEFDETTNRATIYLKEDLQTQKIDLIKRIGEVDPSVPTTNAGWIAWAKAHYPYVDHSLEQVELDRISAILEAIKVV